MRPTKAEYYGSKLADKESFDMGDLPDLLGEKMPHIDFTRVGRIRLMSALRNRFGDDFRNMKSVTGIIQDFDTKLKHAQVIRLNYQERAKVMKG